MFQQREKSVVQIAFAYATFWSVSAGEGRELPQHVNKPSAYGHFVYWVDVSLLRMSLRRQSYQLSSEKEATLINRAQCVK